jgi:hypothetical protein
MATRRLFEHENDAYLYLPWILQTWTDSFETCKNKKYVVKFLFKNVARRPFGFPVTLFSCVHKKCLNNPSRFAESKANAKVHSFHVQTASWWPF